MRTKFGPILSFGKEAATDDHLRKLRNTSTREEE